MVFPAGMIGISPKADTFIINYPFSIINFHDNPKQLIEPVGLA